MNEYIINEENTNKRLDVFLNEIYRNLSRSNIQKNIKTGIVKVNNKIEKNSYKLKLNDIVNFNDFYNKNDNVKIEPQNINLDIKYEDDTIIVVNKPKNMLTHPTINEQKNTLVNGLLYKYGRDGLSSCNDDEFRPGIVHRLDRNTSGLLLVAKTNESYEFLTKQIKEKTAIRKYKAIVEGNIENDYGEIRTLFGRDKKHKEKMAVLESNGKEAVTLYKVIERFKNYTFIEFELKTGRTHQIRVHSKYINHPIVNDSLYGARKFKVNTKEQVLQAYYLEFTNLNNQLQRVIINEDEDLTKVLRYLRSKK